MAVPRWNPPIELSRAEAMIVGRLARTRKLFAFLRLHRHEIFDATLQDKLAGMYRDSGAGKDPLPPALLAAVVLLQAYLRISDAEAVELALMDRRWQLVLDCAGAEEPPFSQGALFDFRERLIAHDLDREVLEHTARIARASGAFDAGKLPKTLRVAVDSRPLVGAGRVEDTLNLLGHAARKIVRAAARLLDRPVADVCREAGAPSLSHTSVKAALDCDWSDPAQKQGALAQLDRELLALDAWLARVLPTDATDGPLSGAVATLAQIRAQDTARDARGVLRIREGVAPDRRVSIEDGEMRHGRKSKTKRFDGYKEHVATDLDTALIHAATITPANRPEAEAAVPLRADIARQGHSIGTFHIDLGYLASPAVREVTEAGGRVVCKPWPGHRPGGLFPKTVFLIDVARGTVTCPAGETEDITLGTKVQFDGEVCDACPLRAQCTDAAPGEGRAVTIAADEPLRQQLRANAQTAGGRAELRERTGVEHRLAHLAARQGPRARYRGVRKNQFDLYRTCAIQNLEAWQRAEEARALAA